MLGFDFRTKLRQVRPQRVLLISHRMALGTSQKRLMEHHRPALRIALFARRPSQRRRPLGRKLRFERLGERL